MSWFCCQKTPNLEKETEYQMFQPKVNDLINAKTRRSVKRLNHSVDISTKCPGSKEIGKLQNDNEFTKARTSAINFEISGCKYEDHRNHPFPALPGLHCDIIDDSYYIGQRLISSLINQYDLVNVFKEKQISLIINLQKPFESTNCRMNEEIDIESGYSYSPGIFSSQGICVIQTGLNESSVPDSFEYILKTLREIAYVIQIEQKRVYIHSHIGVGRTCLVMVCYKIFTENLTTDSAYQYIKKHRECSQMSQDQINFCKEFEQKLKKLNLLFLPNKADIGFFLQNQINLSIYPLTIDIENSTLFIPKLMRISLSRIIILQKKLNLSRIEIYKALNGTNELNDLIYKAIATVISKLKATDYSIIEESENIMILAEVLYVWMSKSVISCIEPSKIGQIFQGKIDNETIDSLLINNTLTLNERKMKELQSIVYNSFNKVEYEIFKYVSWFVSHNLPSIVEETEEYDLMLEKLSIYLIGYSIDMLYTENELIYRKTIAQTISLFKLFITSEIFNDKINSRLNNYLSLPNTYYLNNLSKTNLLNNSRNSLPHPGNLSTLNEHRLYELYYSLKKHFEPKEFRSKAKSIMSKFKNNKKSVNQRSNVSFSNTNIIYKG